MILKFSQTFFETVGFWCIDGLTTILHFLQRKHSIFLISSCCLVKGGRAMKVAQQFAIRGLVAYKQVTYRKTKCSKSIPMVCPSVD